MDALLKKLNHAGGPVVVVDAPAEFGGTLQAWAGHAAVADSLAGQDGFVLAFAAMQADVGPLVDRIVPALGEDAVFWIAYPKKSSKRYRSDMGRDDSWGPLGQHGFEPVRQVAIDEDWSALRFRRVEHIRSMRRNPAMALSDDARRRLAREQQLD